MMPSGCGEQAKELQDDPDDGFAILDDDGLRAKQLAGARRTLARVRALPGREPREIARRLERAIQAMQAAVRESEEARPGLLWVLCASAWTN